MNFRDSLDYKKIQLNNIEKVLERASKLISFIRVYGEQHFCYYFCYILNINNMVEHYLQNFDSSHIDRLYKVYQEVKMKGKTEKEILEQLIIAMERIPGCVVADCQSRRERNAIRSYNINSKMRKF